MKTGRDMVQIRGQGGREMGGYSAAPVNYEEAAGKVKGPAMAIMIIGALGILWCLVFLALNLLGTGLGALGGAAKSDRVVSLLSGGLGIMSNVLGLVVYGLAIFGGLKMSKLESYTMAWVGTIAVSVPCACCCLFGLPVAVWSVIMLLNEDVKKAFAG
jgi:hypothetical protein